MASAATKFVDTNGNRLEVEKKYKYAKNYTFSYNEGYPHLYLLHRGRKPDEAVEFVKDRDIVIDEGIECIIKSITDTHYSCGTDTDEDDAFILLTNENYLLTPISEGGRRRQRRKGSKTRSRRSRSRRSRK